MIVLVDEDLASHELIDRLRAELVGHEVLEPERGQPDEAVWDRAKRAGAAILTMNVRDFVPRAAAEADHPGLLLVTRHNDSTRDLRAVQIADLVVKIVRDHPTGLTGLLIWVQTYNLRGNVGT